MPALTDYGGTGPFVPIIVNNTGPDGLYTMFRPQVLGENGFKHRPATWGNGITTTLGVNNTGFGQTTGAYRDLSNTNDPGGRIVEFSMRLNF